MVLDDFSRDLRSTSSATPSSKKEPADFGQLASPLDRLAANVADFIVYFPVLALIAAPFSRQAKEAQILGHDEVWSLCVFGAIAASALGLLAYQTLFVSWWGATPGKLALRLRVISVWTGKAPTPGEAFVRAILWQLEAVLGGVPFLGVFADARRRPWHDRVADCAVVSLVRERYAGPPKLAEASIVSGFQAAIFAVIALGCALELSELRDRRTSVVAKAEREEERGRLCREVGEAVEDAERDVNSHRDRLDIALTMFESDELDPDCLDSEADFALWNNQEPALGYLAKGLAVNDEEQAEQYFAKACVDDEVTDAVERDVCHMVTIARAESDQMSAANLENDPEAAEERETAVRETIAKVDDTSSTFLKVSVLRHDLQQRDYRAGLRRLASLGHSRALGAFVAKKRAQALWGLGHVNEARAAMLSATDLVDRKDRVDMARWFCSAELFSSGCTEAKSEACSLLDREINASDTWLLRPEIAAPYLHAYACQNNRDPESWNALSEKMPLREGRIFIEAMRALEAGQRTSAVVKLRALADSTAESHGPFFLEATSHLAELAGSAGELAPVLKRWQKLDPNEESWKPLGQSLIRRFNALKLWDSSIAVGLQLNRHDPFDQGTIKILALAAHASGRDQLAQGLAQSLPSGAVSARAPASESTEDKTETETENEEHP